MGKWSGEYEDTKESNNSLEEDIRREAEEGRSTGKTSDGGTIRQTPDRIDVYGPDDSKKGHSHKWYDRGTNTHGERD